MTERIRVESWMRAFGLGALAQEQVEDVLGGAVAEELAEVLLVPGDVVGFNQGEEVLRGVAGERGAGEVGVGGEEVFRAGVEVGEVAAASAGDEDLLAGLVGVVEDEGAASAVGGVHGAEEAGGSGAEDQDVGPARSGGGGHQSHCQDKVRGYGEWG